MLFKVTDNPVKEDNPEIEAIEEFEGVSDRNLKWIFLVFDHKSPFRLLPLEKRKEKVGDRLGFKREQDGRWDKYARDVFSLKYRNIGKATRAFLELDYDDDVETLKSYDAMLSEIRNLMATPSRSISDAKKKTEVAKAFKDLLKDRKAIIEILELKGEINVADEKEDDVIVRNTSLLDEINEQESNGKN